MPDELADLLKHLPEPQAPPSTTASVMARIARETDAVRVEPAQERPTWLWSVMGLVVVMGAAMYGWVQGIGLPDLVGAKIGGRLAFLPVGGPVAAVMTIGLLVYLAGLFAPLRSRGR